MSVRKQLERFAKSTSMHGFGRIVLTKKPEKRVAWMIVFLSAWSLFAYQLYYVLDNYFKYSIKTITEFIPGGAPFPDITLCNMQSLDFYAVHKLLQAVDGFQTGSNASLAEFVGRNNSLAFHIAQLYDLFRSGLNLSSEDYYKLYARTTIAANLPRTVVEENTIRQEEFIVKCAFGNSKCNFKNVSHHYYLRCFTFCAPNSKRNAPQEFESLSEGIENGFSVTVFGGTKLLNANFTNDFIPGVFEEGSALSGSSGIRLVIHPPGTEPHPLTEGYDIPTGYLASLGIIPRRRKRLGRPHGKCARWNKYQTNLLEKLNKTATEENEPYRKISCERMCMQEHVIKECICYDTSLPNMGDTNCNESGICIHVDLKNNQTGDWQGDEEQQEQEGEEGENFLEHRNIGWGDVNEIELQKCRTLPASSKCFSSNSANTCNASAVTELLRNIRCAENATNQLMTNLELLSKCECDSPCDEFRYDVTYSLARWPSLGYESGAVQKEIFNNEKFLERFTDPEKRQLYESYANKERAFAMKDFAKINVYVTDSTVLQTVEEPATSFTQLVSEIGGQLGLWIGVSVITISEVIETILVIVTGFLRKLCRKLRSKTADFSSERNAKFAEV